MSRYADVILSVTPRKGTPFADAAERAIELAKAATQDVELMTADDPPLRLIVTGEDTVALVAARHEYHLKARRQ